MKVDVYFECAAVLDVNEFIVAQDQVFTIIGDTSGKWFADEDQVLEIKQKDEFTAKITAANLGKSILLSMPAGKYENQKVLTITVVESILEPAASLGLTADQPQPK